VTREVVRDESKDVLSHWGRGQKKLRKIATQPSKETYPGMENWDQQIIVEKEHMSLMTSHVPAAIFSNYIDIWRNSQGKTQGG